MAWEDNWYPGKDQIALLQKKYIFIYTSHFIPAGLVENEENGNLTIKFFSRNRNYFIWPAKEDRQIINENDVLCKCSVYPSSTRNYLVKEHSYIQTLYEDINNAD